MGSDLPVFVLDGAAWLVTYALHSTVLLLAAIVAFAWIGRAAKRSQALADAAPAWRERVGRVALLAGIATASIQTALGIEPFGLRPALVESAQIVDAPPVASVTEPVGHAAHSRVTPSVALENKPQAQPARPRANLAAVPVPVWAAVVAVQHAASLVTPAPAATRVEPRPTPVREESARDPRGTWIVAFLALWGVVAAASFARRYLGWRELRASLSGAEPVTDPDVLANFDRVLARAGLRREGPRGVRLLVAPSLAAPVTRGVLEREVHVPPRALEDLDEDELSALFGHEVAHARRGDPAWLLVFRALEIVFCLQPLNRVVARRLEDDAELLCDDRAVVWTGGRLPLASCLTEVASWLVPNHGAPRWAAPMAAHGARLSRRVERLVDESHAPDAGRRRPLFMGAVVALAGSAIAVVPGFAAQRGAKALPLDLQFEMMLASDRTELSEDVADAAPELGAQDTVAPEVVATEAPIEPAVADTEPIAVVGDEASPLPALSSAPFLGSLGDEPAIASAPTSPIADVLAELERELAGLRLALGEREGGDRLLPGVDALASRVEALRSREAALTALVAAPATTLLSPATTGPTAEDR